MKIAREAQDRLETRLMERFNLTYCSVSVASVNVETRYHTARINNWSMDSRVNSKCDIEAKDINTVEEFMAMKETVQKDRYNILYALYYIAFRQFREEI